MLLIKKEMYDKDKRYKGMFTLESDGLFTAVVKDNRSIFSFIPAETRTLYVNIDDPVDVFMKNIKPVVAKYNLVKDYND